MVQSVLGSLILGYRPLWNQARRLAAVQLYVHSDGLALVDAPHLLRTLQELWSAGSPPLLLSPQSPQLLCDLLAQAPRGAPWISVPEAWVADADLFAQVRAAHQRGLKLVWRGALDRLPPAEVAACFDNSLLTISATDAVAALRAAGSEIRGAPPAPSPVIAGQMYESVASRPLMEHCLDRHSALAIAGWPAEDVLYSLRHQPLQPAHETVFKLMRAIDAEQSLEAFEQILGEDPLLAYRFMIYTNSAALGLRTGVDSLRRGLVMMGYGSLQRWLGDQLPHASTDPNLHPIRESMVIRARLTERLLDAGVENDLRREVYLCGLLSQLGELLSEPLGTVLRRLPLSERIYDAAVLRTGPYAASLEMACALESEDAAPIRQLCETHERDVEEVNRALLRVISDLVVERPAGR
ncbi:HDOD domain-containing protein [Paracidovorax anthurii]|uniref:HDOD domain-containing protein n=1 Tax=Paracidovorax anthurii TaxID=78229 RepID=A0A328Z5T2_9BURK|nr:HDOD domain-containing protein [Paracidovorax anthurii]RAR79962.1 HDOD domain-containing protein [Paracidovorax anthurii]WCM92755.1 HDOD domain-containing protein [Acidovorax sp. NCPPB 2350]